MGFIRQVIDVSEGSTEVVFVETHRSADGPLTYRTADALLRRFQRLHGLHQDAPVWAGDSTGRAVLHDKRWKQIRQDVRRLARRSPDKHFRFRTEEEEHITVDYMAIVQVGGVVGVAFAGECEWD
jgi:hypothetical protein